MHSNHKCNYCELSLSPLLKWLIESCLCLASCDKNRLIRYILQWVRNVLLFSMCLLLMGDNKSKSSITCDTIRIFLIFGKGKLVRLGSFCCIKNNEDAISALLSLLFAPAVSDDRPANYCRFYYVAMLFFLQCWQFKCFNNWLCYQMLIYLHDKWEYGSKTFVLQLLDIRFIYNWTWQFLNPFQDIA